MVMAVDQVGWHRERIEAIDDGNRRRTKFPGDFSEQRAVSDGTIAPV
jgi:hypothetical protein